MLVLNKLDEAQIRRTLTANLEAFANLIFNADDLAVVSVIKSQLIYWNFRIARWIVSNYCNSNINTDFMFYMLYVQYRLHQAIELLHLMELNEDLDMRLDASRKIRAAVTLNSYTKPLNGYNLYYIPAPKCDRKNADDSLYVPSNARLQPGKRFHRNYYLKIQYFADSNRLTILPKRMHNYLRLKLLKLKFARIKKAEVSEQQEIVDSLKELVEILADNRELQLRALKNQLGRIKYMVSNNSKEIAKVVVREPPTKLSSWKEYLQHIVMQILANDNISLQIDGYKIALYCSNSLIRYNLRAKSISNLNSIVLSLLLAFNARWQLKRSGIYVQNFTPPKKSNCSFATQCSYNPSNPKLPVSVMPIVQSMAYYLQKQFETKHCKLSMQL